MKIDAFVAIKNNLHDKVVTDFCNVQVDIDYVEDNEDSVNEWIRQELENIFHVPVMNEDFEVHNMTEILENIAFDEFESKVLS